MHQFADQSMRRFVQLCFRAVVPSCLRAVVLSWAAALLFPGFSVFSLLSFFYFLFSILYARSASARSRNHALCYIGKREEVGSVFDSVGIVGLWTEPGQAGSGTDSHL